MRSMKKMVMAAIGMEFFDPWKKANKIFGVESTFCVGGDPLPLTPCLIEVSISMYYIYSI